MTTVVNASNDNFEVYCGTMYADKTKSHFGNPFCHHQHTSVKNKVATLEDAIACFEAWLLEEAFTEIEPERRAWVHDNLPSLKGKVLGVPMGFGKPWHPSHGDVLAKYAEVL